jgi:putative endonuclease
MYVYILRSINFPDKIYIGKTRNLKKRLAKHNEGGNISTLRYKPWKYVWFSWFETDNLASNFEMYLKTGSGFAFRKKRLVT